MLGGNWKFVGPADSVVKEKKLSKDPRLGQSLLTQVAGNVRKINAAIDGMRKSRGPKSTSLVVRKPPEDAPLQNLFAINEEDDYLLNLDKISTLKVHRRSLLDSLSQLSSEDVNDKSTQSQLSPKGSITSTKTSKSFHSHRGKRSTLSMRNESNNIGTITPRILPYPVNEEENKHSTANGHTTSEKRTSAIQTRPTSSAKPKMKKETTIQIGTSSVLQLQKVSQNSLSRASTPTSSLTSSLAGDRSNNMPFSHQPKPLPAHDANLDTECQYLMRKTSCKMAVAVNQSDSTLSVAWDRLINQTMREMHPSLESLAGKGGASDSAAENSKSVNLKTELICAAKLKVAATKIAAFHDWLGRKGNSVIIPNILYYGEDTFTSTKNLPESKNRAPPTKPIYTGEDVVKLQRSLLQASKMALESISTKTPTTIKKSVFMSTVSDGSRIICYPNGAPAVIQSYSVDGGYYYIILGRNPKCDSYFRGMITPSSSCTFYQQDGSLWYIHSGSCGFWFYPDGKIKQQWTPSSHPPPSARLQLNENISVKVLTGLKWELCFTCDKKKLVITLECNPQHKSFVFNDQDELRTKYGSLKQVNGYCSLASRDHRPNLLTYKHDPISQEIPEGAQVMTLNSNHTRHMSRRQSTDPWHRDSLAPDMLDYYIKKPLDYGTVSPEILLYNLENSELNASRPKKDLQLSQQIERRQSRGLSPSNNTSVRTSPSQRRHSSRLSSQTATKHKRSLIPPHSSNVSNQSTLKKHPVSMRKGSHLLAPRVQKRSSLSPQSARNSSARVSMERSSSLRLQPLQGLTNLTQPQDAPKLSISRATFTLMRRKNRGSSKSNLFDKMRHQAIIMRLLENFSKRSKIESRSWSLDDPLTRHYTREREKLSNKVRDILGKWGVALLHYLGMSKAYAATYTQRVCNTARQEYRISADCLKYTNRLKRS